MTCYMLEPPLHMGNQCIPAPVLTFFNSQAELKHVQGQLDVVSSLLSGTEVRTQH